MLAGSTGNFEIRYFDMKDDFKCKGQFKEGLNKGIFSLDFANTKEEASYGCGDGVFGQLQF